MTIEKLLESLLKEREIIDAAISKIHQFQAGTRIRARAKEITDTVKPVPERLNSTNKGFRYKKGTHWTQKPENKDRLRKMLSKQRSK